MALGRSAGWRRRSHGRRPQRLGAEGRSANRRASEAGGIGGRPTPCAAGQDRVQRGAEHLGRRRAPRLEQGGGGGHERPPEPRPRPAGRSSHQRGVAALRGGERRVVSPVVRLCRRVRRVSAARPANQARGGGGGAPALGKGSATCSLRCGEPRPRRSRSGRWRSARAPRRRRDPAAAEGSSLRRAAQGGRGSPGRAHLAGPPGVGRLPRPGVSCGRATSG